MPTGYTADIKDGITFEQFAMGCARAFGACIDLRDAPSDAEIPHVFKPSTYHLEQRIKAEEQLFVLDGMTVEEAEQRATEAWDVAETARLESLRRVNELRAKYEAMLVKINAWAPPSSDHTHLKAFMLQQVTESIKFDCDLGSYYDTPTVKQSGDEWFKLERDRVLRDIDYHTKNYHQEVERCRRNTEWVNELRVSLMGGQ